MLRFHSHFRSCHRQRFSRLQGVSSGSAVCGAEFCRKTSFCAFWAGETHLLRINLVFFDILNLANAQRTAVVTKELPIRRTASNKCLYAYRKVPTGTNYSLVIECWKRLWLYLPTMHATQTMLYSVMMSVLYHQLSNGDLSSSINSSVSFISTDEDMSMSSMTDTTIRTTKPMNTESSSTLPLEAQRGLALSIEYVWGVSQCTWYTPRSSNSSSSTRG